MFIAAPTKEIMKRQHFLLILNVKFEYCIYFWKQTLNKK